MSNEEAINNLKDIKEYLGNLKIKYSIHDNNKFLETCDLAIEALKAKTMISKTEIGKIEINLFN